MVRKYCRGMLFTVYNCFPAHVKAEAEYWRRSEGYRVGRSDQILGFDCGGEQWVLEVAFPTGTIRCTYSPWSLPVLLARQNDS